LKQHNQKLKILSHSALEAFVLSLLEALSEDGAFNPPKFGRVSGISGNRSCAANSLFTIYMLQVL